MKKNKDYCIDLTDRKMLYEPWLIKKEKKKIYSISVRFKILLYLFIFLLCFFLYSCENKQINKTTPKVVRGLIDLTNYDLKKDGPINLDGEWEFYWEELLEPSAFKAKNNPIMTGYIPIPGDWKGYKLPDGKEAGPYSYATFRLKILTNGLDGNNALSIPGIGTSYRLYINSELFALNGKVAKTEKEMIPNRIPIIKDICIKDKIIELVIQVSNFQYISAGIWSSIVLGDEESLRNSNFWHNFINSLMVGVIFIMGLYHIGLFIQRKKDKASLFFALFCFLVIIRTLAMEYYIQLLFPSVNLFDLSLRLEFLGFYLGVPIFVTFIYSLYPKELNLLVLRCFQLIGILFSISLFVFSPKFFMAYTINIYQIITIIACSYVIFVIARALYHKRRGALLSLQGFIFIFLVVLNDILHSNYIIRTMQLFPFGLIAFIFYQSLILSSIFSHTFKRAEKLTKELENEKKSLKKKVKERTKKLEKANLELKELDKAKNRFFTNISHELRTPLTLIKSPIQAILNRRYGTSIKSNDNIFKIIHRNCSRLLGLINNLLDFYKIESGRMELKRKKVDIIRLLEIYAAEVESTTRSKKIGLEFVNNTKLKKLTASIDEKLFEKAIFNLLSNALKFTEQGGRVKLELEHKTEPPEFRIKVKDTGIGIPRDKLEYIFERFHQVDEESNRKYEGTGIGLSLTKEIIEMHGGKIEVTSEIGKGSEFCINIPIVYEEYAEIDKKQEQIKEEICLEEYTEKQRQDTITQKQTHKTIFIVEDNRDMVEYLTGILKEKYNTEQAYNGKQAWEKMNKGLKPDLILADIMMPEMDGCELYCLLKADDILNQIPFIFLTARASEEEKLKSLKHGVIDYIYKPFSAEELVIKIDNILKREENIKASFRKEIKQRINKAIAGEEVNNKEVKLSEQKLEQYTITGREREIIELIREGLQDKEIAAELGISVRTVSKHVQNVFGKVGVNNRTELINKLLIK